MKYLNHISLNDNKCINQDFHGVVEIKKQFKNIDKSCQDKSKPQENPVNSASRRMVSSSIGFGILSSFAVIAVFLNLFRLAAH